MVFYAVVFIDIGSPRVSFIMCLFTALTIAMLTLVIMDLDDPFHGAFNVRFVGGQSEDVISTLCAAIQVNRSMDKYDGKWLDRKTRFERVATFFHARRRAQLLSLPDDEGRRLVRTLSQRETDNAATLDDSKPDHVHLRRRSIERLQSTLMTPKSYLVRRPTETHRSFMSAADARTKTLSSKSLRAGELELASIAAAAVTAAEEKRGATTQRQQRRPVVVANPAANGEADDEAAVTVEPAKEGFEVDRGEGGSLEEVWRLRQQLQREGHSAVV